MITLEKQHISRSSFMCSVLYIVVINTHTKKTCTLNGFFPVRKPSCSLMVNGTDKLNKISLHACGCCYRFSCCCHETDARQEVTWRRAMSLIFAFLLRCFTPQCLTSVTFACSFNQYEINFMFIYLLTNK